MRLPCLLPWSCSLPWAALSRTSCNCVARHATRQRFASVACVRNRTRRRMRFRNTGQVSGGANGERGGGRLLLGVLCGSDPSPRRPALKADASPDDLGARCDLGRCGRRLAHGRRVVQPRSVPQGWGEVAWLEPAEAAARLVLARGACFGQAARAIGPLPPRWRSSVPMRALGLVASRGLVPTALWPAQPGGGSWPHLG